MTPKTVFYGLLTGFLCVALAIPARADIPSKGQSVAIVVAAVALVAVIVIFTARAFTHNKQITGCVVASDKGTSITDEKDHQMYQLAGGTANIQPGERVRLQLKRIKSKDKATATTWQVEKLVKDYGACHP